MSAAGLSSKNCSSSLKVFLAASLFIAQIAAAAHADHDHEEGPGSAAECAVCLVQSVSDDDDAGVIPSAADPSTGTSPRSVITAAVGALLITSLLDRPSARGPPPT